MDDVAFIKDMVAAISRTAAVDLSRIDATGISNGGLLAYRLACDTSTFAAIGPVAATLAGSCPTPHQLSVIHVHGTAIDGVGRHDNHLAVLRRPSPGGVTRPAHQAQPGRTRKATVDAPPHRDAELVVETQQTTRGRHWPARLVSVPAWARYVGGGAAATGLYYLLPELHAPQLWRVIVYVLISASAVAAVLAGVHTNRPGYRTPWYLLAVGQAAYALGDFTFYLDRMVLHIDYYPFVDDAFYLTSYPLMAAGLLLFVRRRTPSWDLASAIDATIVAVGAGLVMWIYLMAPQLTDTTQSPWARAASVAYPAMDLLLLTVMVRMVLGRTRPALPHTMLYAWVGLVFVADVVYGYQELSGTYDVGNYLDLLWLTAALLLGGAALHPRMRSLEEPVPVPDPYAGTGRLVVLAIASLMAPALLYVQYLRHAPLHIPLIVAACTCSFLLVLGRMRGVAQTQRHAAITDGLTGLRTRRFLLEALARHTGPGTGFLLLDLDHFKRVNDSYGHAAGDAVLREVARRLRLTVRHGDVVARYGGEEFAVLLPRTRVEEIVNLAERIRHSLASVPIAAGEQWLVVTASVGATSLRPGQSIDDLVADADRALYLAKESGRNRVAGPLPAADPQPTTVEAARA